MPPESVDDDGDVAVARDVARRAEAVHRDIEGYDQRLFARPEAEDAAQQSERRHDGAAGHAGGGHNRDTHHQDEARELAGRVRHPFHYHQRHRTGHNLERRAGHMDRGAERHDETGDVLAHS